MKNNSQSGKEQNSDAEKEPPESETEEEEPTSSDNAKDEPSEKDEHSSFPIVGMGASAGGLEAFENFFSEMPPDSGMAFVLVPHLDPSHKSMMVELLRRVTKMEVLEVEDGMEVQLDRVYVIPPNKDMGIINGTLQLMEPTETPRLRVPIDSFFRSLAQDQGEHAICIILSGTGTSGTLGLKSIKGEGGLVIVQDPEDAKYDGMPKSAIATGLVDYILPAKEMPDQLISYVEHSNMRYVREKAKAEKAPDSLKKIFMIIRNQTGHDFSLYKPNTIRRRIERRMIVHQIDNLENYVSYLQQNAHEVEMLFKELLIGVTNFFRDPEAFEILKKDVLPYILEDKSFDNSLVRVWVPGCATGEEAYSIAIIFQEYMIEHKRDLRVQIFATDIDESAIEVARIGIYPESIAVDVSSDRLKKFFTKENNNYHIKGEIREMVVFATQNLIKDPPFSKLDLISCRNLLIYLSPELQKKILPLFHYVLNPKGVLFLGSSETIGGFINFFSPFNSKWKFFTSKDLPPSQKLMVEFPSTIVRENDIAEIDADRTSLRLRNNTIARISERILLDNYAPPCALINENNEILYIHGRTGKYLEPAQGEARLDILDMAREGLKGKLMSAIREALSQKTTVVNKGLRVKTNNEYQLINLIVKPIKSLEAMRGLMMVVFQDVSYPEDSESSEKETEPSTMSPSEAEQRVVELEQELSYTRENLQTTVEELETSNEELKSSNEELQSTNEELQSANEELETSKEELQSLNEELTTVNSELQEKIDQLSGANDDIKNLLDNTNIATIFLDNDLRIKRFTPAATEMMNLIEADQGRSIEDITLKLRDENLVEAAQKVLRTLIPQEKEVQTKDEKWHLMRIKPYRTTNNVIDGVVITFVDIHEQKRMQQALQDAREYAESIVNTVPTPLIVLDADLKIISANHCFYQIFKVVPQETEGQLIYDLGSGQLDIPKLRELLEEMISSQTTIEDFKIEHDFPDIGKRIMSLNARRIHQESEDSQMILVAIEDITENES